jgi:hypothetical protein
VLRLIVVHCSASRAIVRQGRVAVGDAKDPRSERDLLSLECIRITSAVPPFVMPTYKKLDAARHTASSSFLFADHRMALQVEYLVGRQHSAFANVLTAHHDFADVVDESRLAA